MNIFNEQCKPKRSPGTGLRDWHAPSTRGIEPWGSEGRCRLGLGRVLVTTQGKTHLGHREDLGCAMTQKAKVWGKVDKMRGSAETKTWEKALQKTESFSPLPIFQISVLHISQSPWVAGQAQLGTFGSGQGIVDLPLSQPLQCSIKGPPTTHGSHSGVSMCSVRSASPHLEAGYTCTFSGPSRALHQKLRGGPAAWFETSTQGIPVQVRPRKHHFQRF